MDIARQVALEDAVDSGDEPKAHALMTEGADPNGACHGLLDKPIFELAIDRCDGAMMQLLRSHGADFDRGDTQGRTPLHRCAGASDGDDRVRLLLELGVDPNAADSQGWTALHFASAYGYEANVLVLLAAGADRNRVTSTGLSPQLMASRNGHGRIADLLGP